jgi:hypothetical protein
MIIQNKKQLSLHMTIYINLKECLMDITINACQSFQALMNQVLRRLTWKHCFVYVDDVIIWSKDFESHLQHLDLVFQRLRKANLTLRPNKCEFAKPEILYLGHFISGEGIKVDPSKTEAAKSLPTPQTQHDVRSFLGLNGYYRKYVKAKMLF